MKKILSFFKKLKKTIKLLIPNSLLFNPYFNLLISRWRLKPKDLLRFEVHIAEHCNLNCRGCEHFSSIANESYLSIDIFERDCKRLFELTNGNISRIELLGGEPLLHPKLVEILSISRKYFKSSDINILTNGMLLLSQPDEFWINCKQNRINLFITKYPIKLKYDAIDQLARKHGIDLHYFGGTDKSIKQMYCVPIDLTGTQNNKDSFKKCFRSNTCIQLQDGKLFTCQIIPYIKHFNKYFNQNLEITENDYIDIYKAKNIEEILHFLSTPIPFCRYCNVNKTVYGIEWGISKKEISEWV
jgi:MoaA/NifB/PqqE/SkfB family radical SAM enzyme